MLPKYFHIGWKFQRIFKSSMSFCHPNNFLHTSYLSASKQMFHAFLFNIRNYSSEVRNIQRRKSELNIILPRVNNSILTKDSMIMWHNYVPCLFVFYIHQARNKKWVNVHKVHNYSSDNRIIFFLKKNQLEHFFSFWIICKSTEFKLCNMKLAAWPEIKSWNLFRINGIAVIDVTKVKRFPVISPR